MAWKLQKFYLNGAENISKDFQKFSNFLLIVFILIMLKFCKVLEQNFKTRIFFNFSISLQNFHQKDWVNFNHYNKRFERGPQTVGEFLGFVKVFTLNMASIGADDLRIFLYPNVQFCPRKWKSINLQEKLIHSRFGSKNY